MEIKVGQYYKGNKSGRIRQVVNVIQEGDNDQVETVVELYEQNDNVRHFSTWTSEQLEKCCTLVKEVKP